jgi:predicted site-specific integrase-resolvase
LLLFITFYGVILDIKLSDYAKKVGVTYKTAWRWFQAGKIKGYQMDTGTIIITEESQPELSHKVVIYARVSSSENRANPSTSLRTSLDSQAQRLMDYCAAKGWQVSKVVKEIGSGIHDNRRQFMALLSDPTISRIVVEHKDRATRFGFNYIEALLSLQGRKY